jgi:hypothetical protein
MKSGVYRHAFREAIPDTARAFPPPRMKSGVFGYTNGVTGD